MGAALSLQSEALRIDGGFGGDEKTQKMKPKVDPEFDLDPNDAIPLIRGEDIIPLEKQVDTLDREQNPPAKKTKLVLTDIIPQATLERLARCGMYFKLQDTTSGSAGIFFRRAGQENWIEVSHDYQVFFRTISTPDLEFIEDLLCHVKGIRIDIRRKVREVSRNTPVPVHESYPLAAMSMSQFALQIFEKAISEGVTLPLDLIRHLRYFIDTLFTPVDIPGKK